jgi:hypothetical protein
MGTIQRRETKVNSNQTKLSKEIGSRSDKRNDKYYMLFDKVSFLCCWVEPKTTKAKESSGERAVAEHTQYTGHISMMMDRSDNPYYYDDDYRKVLMI